MKRKTTQQEKITRLIDKELSEYINKQDVVYREEHLRTATKLSVLNFKSLPKKAKVSDFIGALTSDYQHLVDYTDGNLTGDVQKLKGQAHISDAEDEQVDIERQISDVQNKIVPLKGKFDDTPKKYLPEIRKWFWLFIPLLILIATMELISNFDSLDSLGGNRISSFGLAFLTGIIVYWYAHFTPGKIKKYGNNNPKRELLLFFFFLIPILVVFYFFSLIRIQYTIALNPQMVEVYTTSPWVFTIINAFAYTISCWIIWAFKPSHKMILAYKKYRNDLIELQKAEQELEDLHQRQAALQPELREKLTLRYEILRLGKQTEDEIVTKMRGCFELFKMELYLKTNGTCGVLFTGDIDKDLPKLKLNYQNINDKFPAI